ncbi:MAG TPA: adenylate/guanylate cyclase domain-containing protein [Candidatus Acidoferrum sp.]|nr:adenylate/guanylate cyclase domain-containing protein [Candidatus Acidoferrum sp.]
MKDFRLRLRLSELRSRHRRFLLGLALGFVASAGVAAVTSLGYFSGYQGKALDLYFWAQGRARAPEIVLVAIDDAAFHGLKDRQPLPRDYLAGVIRGLRKCGARAIGVDVDLRQPTIPAQDRALVAAIRGDPGDPTVPVVVARTLSGVPAAGDEIRFLPRPLYAAALEADSGFAEVPKDEDGFFRRIPLAVPLPDGQFFPSLSLALLARLGGQDVATLASRLAGPEPVELSLPEWDEARGRLLGDARLRFFRDDDWKINFIGPAGSLLTIGSDAVYQLGISDQEIARDNPFRDRIVLVGASFEESRDAYPTPRGILPGFEIHANILHTLLTRSQIQPIAWGMSLALQFVVCLLLALLFAVVRPNRALLISFAGAAVVTAGTGAWGAAHGSYWFDFLTPILAIRIGSGLHDGMERRRIRESFHQYIGREVADRVYRDDRSLHGQRRTVTVMFTDLRNFTTLSETMAADHVAQQLNEYFPMMVDAVLRYRGVVNDFIGDAVMAIYGVPVDNPEHALDAVRTGLEMQAGLEALNTGWQARGLPTLRMGIGIHTGSVFAGNVGSPTRKKYTVVGDAVNVAARVEGLNKELATTLLITGETYAAVKDWVEAKDCGEMKVKGRHQAVKVYEVLALAGSAAGRDWRPRWRRDGAWSWWRWRPWRRRAASPPKRETPSPS